MSPPNEGITLEDGDSLVVDMSGYSEAAGFEVMPRGRYPVICNSCEFDISSNDNPMWSMEWEVEEGEFAGRKLFTHWTWTEKAAPFVKKDMAQVRPDLLEAPFDVKDQEILDSMLGVRATANVTIKKFEGEDRNNVRGLLKASASDEFA